MKRRFTTGRGSAVSGLQPSSIGLSLRLGRRFMRSRSLAVSTWLMAAVSAMVVALFIVMSAFTLSIDQLNEREFGRFHFASNLAKVLEFTPMRSLKPQDASLATKIEAAALAGGATNPMVTLISLSVEPAQVDPPHTRYLEADWSRNPFPDRYILLSGHWPEQPGEVVLAHTENGSLAASGEWLPVLAGHERFFVVGIADNRYIDDHEILAAPGTYAGIGEAALRSFPHLGAYATLYWEGSQRQPVIDAVSASLVQELGLSPDEVAPIVAEFTRDRTEQRVESPWIDWTPSSYAVPSLLLPFLASLAIFGLGQRRLRRSQGLLVAMGLQPAHAARALGLAVTGWLLAALVGGVGAGLLIGIAGRLIITQFHLWAQPLSPLPNLTDPVVRLAASAVVACVVGTVLLRFAVANEHQPQTPAFQEGQPSTPGHRRLGTRVRHGIAVLAACASIFLVSRLDEAPEAMVLAGTMAVTVLLLVPEVMGWAVRRLPRTDPRLRLTRQQLLHDRTRGAIAVAVLAAVLGLPLGYLALFDTMIKTAESGLIPRVTPHQVLVGASGSEFAPPPAEVLAVVEGQLGATHPTVQLRYLHDAQDGFIHIKGTLMGAILALDTPDDVSRLIEHSLTEAERAALVEGGLLVWDGRESGERVLVTGIETGLEEEARLPATAVRIPPAWKRSIHGVLLTDTAKQLKLPVKDGGVVFTGVSDSEAREARRMVLDAGLDPYHVTIYEPPEVYVPEALFAAAAGLMLIVLLCSIAVARAQVLTLRRYLGTLIAIGLTPGWARQAVLVQIMFFVAVSIVVALVLAIPPVVIATVSLSGFVLSIPWRVIGLVIAAFSLAVLIASVLSSRQIRPSDRVAL